MLHLLFSRRLQRLMKPPQYLWYLYVLRAQLLTSPASQAGGGHLLFAHGVEGEAEGPQALVIIYLIIHGDQLGDVQPLGAGLATVTAGGTGHQAGHGGYYLLQQGLVIF